MSAVSVVSAVSSNVRLLFPETCGEGLIDRAVSRSNVRFALQYPDRLTRPAAVRRLVAVPAR